MIDRKMLLVGAIFVLIAASLAALRLTSPAFAEERLVPQFGNEAAPTAIMWSPDGKWLATATESDIVLWNAETGAILRAMQNPYLATEFTLIDGGRIVAAQDGSGHTWARQTETGAAYPLEDTTAFKNVEWRNIAFYDTQFLFGEKAETFLDNGGIRSLIKGPLLKNKNDVLEVIKTNAKDVVVAIYTQKGTNNTAEFSVYIDTKKKGSITTLDVNFPALKCGSPDVAFAKYGDKIALAPTASDASHFFLNAAVVNIAQSPPKVAWTHFCRNYMFSSIWMDRGRIVACADPTNCTVWDPNTAKIVEHLGREPDHSNVPETTSPDGKYRRVVSAISRDRPVYFVVETATGRRVLSFKENFSFSSDARHVWTAGKAQDQSISYWSLTTGKRLWTATEIDGEDEEFKGPYLIVEYTDGKVRLSKGAEKLVRIVDGFNSRPFTRADAQKFIEK